MRLYAPGERRGNRYYIAKGSIGGREYEVVCRDEGGRPTQDRRAARRFAQQFERAARAEARRGPPQTFAEVAAVYVEAVNAGPAQRRYVERLKGALINGRPLGDLCVADLRQADLDQAVAALYPARYTNQTRNRQGYAPAAAVLHYAAGNEWCAYWPVRKQKEPEPETRRPMPGVRERLLRAAKGKERAFLTVLFFQGLRVTEALSLSTAHTSVAEGWLEVESKKARRWKRVLMHPEVREALANMKPEAGGRWFPWRSRWRVYDWLGPLCARLGVRFTPHMARHLFGAEIRKLGGTLRDIGDLGSWFDLKSVARYDIVDDSHKRELLSRLRVTKSGRDRGRRAKCA